MNHTTRHYMGHVPGWQFACDIYADSDREARAELRRLAGVARLPRGSAVWLHTPLPPAPRDGQGFSLYLG